MGGDVEVARACKFMAVSFMSNKNKNSIPVRILPPHNFKLIKYLRVEGERLGEMASGGGEAASLKRVYLNTSFL